MNELYLYTPKSYWGFNVEVMEQKRNCKYVGDFAIKDKNGNWAESPCAIFWQATPPVFGYSHYFAVFSRDDTVYVTSGESIEGMVMTGMVADNGEVIYSRYRHDCVYSADGTAMIDGGRDYVRSSFPCRAVNVRLIGPNLVIEEVPSDELETDTDN
jgi:hypothetical protein